MTVLARDSGERTTWGMHRMSMQDVNDAGSNVMDLVSDAVTKGDFSGLSKSVSTSLANVARKAADALAPTPPSPYFILRPEDRRAGQIQLSGGVVIAFTAGVVDLIMAIMILTGFSSVGVVVAAALFAAVLAFGVGMATTGSKRIGLARHIGSYAKICGERTSIGVTELAQEAGRTEPDVRRDIVQAVKRGLLPHGRLSEDGNTIYLTDDAYAADKPWQANDSDAPDEVRQILDDGNAAIRTIDDCKQKISDAAMTKKLDRLETTVKGILEQVQKKPACARELRRFMSYYLPTTIKLVTSYAELDRQEIHVKNVTATKTEISDTLDTINDAFDQVLDSTYQDEAWDISSDIHVMKTMMEQEGLTNRKGIKADAGSDPDAGAGNGTKKTNG